MIEVTMNYRILPNADVAAYEQTMRRAVGLALVGEMRHHVEDMPIDVWAVSPVVPSPLRPKH